jgi:alpha-tubulin suppressor-like RCC1 family protein
MLVAVRNAATNAHEVWGWGLNTSGQLGIGDQCLRRQRIFFFSERDTTYHDYNNDYRVFRYG